MIKSKASLVSRTIKGRFNLKRLSDINCGYCYFWAWVFFNKYGGELYSVSYFGGHAFVRIYGKFYDAQNSYGVKDWRALACFAFSNRENIPYDFAEHLTKKQFKKKMDNKDLTKRLTYGKLRETIER